MQNHKLGQKKAKRKLVASTGRVSFATPKLKDECFGSLNETDQQKAAEAERKNELSELNGARLVAGDVRDFFEIGGADQVLRVSGVRAARVQRDVALGRGDAIVIGVGLIIGI